MKTCRSLPAGVHLAEHRLDLVTAAAARGDDETIEAVARANDCSPSLLFKLTARARAALAPRRPGPRPLAPTHARVVVAPPTDVTPPPVDPRRAVLEMAVSNATIRGIQRLSVATPN